MFRVTLDFLTALYAVRRSYMRKDLLARKGRLQRILSSSRDLRHMVKVKDALRKVEEDLRTLEMKEAKERKNQQHRALLASVLKE